MSKFFIVSGLLLLICACPAVSISSPDNERSHHSSEKVIEPPPLTQEVITSAEKENQQLLASLHTVKDFGYYFKNNKNNKIFDVITLFDKEQSNNFITAALKIRSKGFGGSRLESLLSEIIERFKELNSSEQKEKLVEITNKIIKEVMKKYNRIDNRPVPHNYYKISDLRFYHIKGILSINTNEFNDSILSYITQLLDYINGVHDLRNEIVSANLMIAKRDTVEKIEEILKSKYFLDKDQDFLQKMIIIAHKNHIAIPMNNFSILIENYNKFPEKKDIFIDKINLILRNISRIEGSIKTEELVSMISLLIDNNSTEDFFVLVDKISKSKNRLLREFSFQKIQNALKEMHDTFMNNSVYIDLVKKVS